MRQSFFYSLLSFSLLSFSCNTNKENSSKLDVLAKDIDSSVKPGDDFFDYANGNWIKNNPIPADESGWGLFQIIPDENLKRLRDINIEVSKSSHPEGSAEQKIGDFWKAANDTDKIEKSGIQPLQPYLAKIDSIHDIASLQNTMAQLDVIGVGGAIAMFVGQDAKNSSIQNLQLYQTGLGLPEREFYFKQDSTSITIRNAYKKNIASILMLLGVDSMNARKSAEDILTLETDLAKASRKIEDLRDPYANYNKYAVNNLNTISPKINWVQYMQIIGIQNPESDTIIVGQPEYYKELGNAFSSFPLDTWKAYLKYRLANEYSAALPDIFGETNFEFEKLFSGVTERRARWKRILGSEQGAMGELLGQIYVKKYFNDKAKERYSQLVENVRTALKNRIEKLDWMSDSTKQKALAKLAKVKKKVGYPDKWKDFSALKITPDNYFQDLVNANIFWHNYNINKLGNPVDKTEWGMFPQTYNAYYDPSNNEIVLPAAAFIVPGYNDDELDDAVVYGYMAASTIGHELTHGFDDEGRQYDGDGNLKGWWTPEDSSKFTMRANKLADQFSKYVVVDTFKINGKATLGENIADLGGVVLGYDAFKLTDEYKKGEKVAGYTPSQRFFLGYALSWLEAERPQSLRTQVLTDVHSPAKFRVNGPLVNVDAFYDAFNIKPGDKMYVPDSSRVRIW
ncbi:MAG: M13 family metallopeptidase [Bacteroidetes bacterium]|nr:M13 family metallopeptidase [Bacteroidota bacterium]